MRSISHAQVYCQHVLIVAQVVSVWVRHLEPVYHVGAETPGPDLLHLVVICFYLIKNKEHLLNDFLKV